MNKRRRALSPIWLALPVFLLCAAIFAVGQFHRASGAVFVPILIERFDASAAAVGGLVSMMFVASVLAQLPFGVALDRFGPRWVLTACMTLTAGGTALFAFAVTFDAVVFARVLIGVGLASMGAATHVLIARYFPARDFGYISGLVLTVGSVGGLLGTFPLTLALTSSPWSLVFGSLAVATLGLAALVAAVIRAPEGDKSKGTDARRSNFLDLLKLSEFQKILVLGIVTYAPITTISGLWGGPYLQSVLGLSATGAGAVLFFLYGGSMVAGLLYGALDRRVRSRRRVILIGVLATIACLLALAVAPVQQTIIPLALLMLFIVSQHFFIPLGAHMRRVVPDDLLGRGSTTLTMVAVAAIPLFQTGFGVILDLGAEAGLSPVAQYRLAFLAMAGVTALCLAVYATAKEIDEPVDAA